jgi:acetate---CoA ligase (ADP-forming)
MTMNRSLDALFRPASVAVIGASRDPASIGGAVFRNLISNGFRGPVYPVNPTATSIQAVRAWPSIADIPDEIDLAVLIIPARLVPAAVDECIAKGVGGVVVLSAGFAEVGGEGKAIQEELVAKCREAGMRLVGPNCLGLLNRSSEIRLDATFAPTWPPEGSVAFSSQSGALGLAILDYALDLGIGISQFISVGNKADVSGNDLVEYWEQDEATRVILLYLESFGNPRKFMEIARRVGRTKPIAAVKSGRTVSGARAATSHTGALASQEAAVGALLAQTGVIRTDTIEELFDMAMLLANQPIPKGNRVGILTNAGGPAIMASDACESRGLDLPILSDDTQEQLRRFLPPEASVRNPVDMIASATPDSFERALSLLLDSEQIDAVMVLFVPPIVTDATLVANAIRHGSAGSDKPVLTCFMGSHGVPPALSSLHEGRIPSYAFPEAAAIALSRAVRYGKWLAREEGEIHLYSEIDRDAATRVLSAVSGSSAWVGQDEVDALFRTWGIPTLDLAMARDVDEAVERATEIGFPVAMKLVSSTLTHKTDVGGVLLDLENEADVRAAYGTIETNLAAAGQPREAMSGVMLQQMAGRGVETFVGLTRDPAFGPLIAFGIGGTAVEVWQDVVFRICPITDADAEEMIDSIRGAALLRGHRGSPPVAREALVDTLLRVSAMAEAHPEIVELDINPLLARAEGSGVVVVDARLRLEPPAPTAP